MNAFMFAAQNGHLNILKKLYESKKFDINETDGLYGETSLYKACSERRELIVEYLISLPEINASIKTNQDNNCLHVACQRSHVEIVKILVESGKVNKKEPGFREMTAEQMTMNDEIKKLLQ
jgi:ankyrin repeat protein